MSNALPSKIRINSELLHTYEQPIGLNNLNAEGERQATIPHGTTGDSIAKQFGWPSAKAELQLGLGAVVERQCAGPLEFDLVTPMVFDDPGLKREAVGVG